jgi:CMP-N-acetylneuraminic acid synthetase
MANLAVIIARKGSKGLPNKAIQPLEGKPLVAWAIEHALGSKRVDEVVLSSDSHDILAVGESYGIHSYERPAHRASATAWNAGRPSSNANAATSPFFTATFPSDRST